MKRIQEEKEKLEEKIRTRRNSVDLMKVCIQIDHIQYVSYECNY